MVQKQGQSRSYELPWTKKASSGLLEVRSGWNRYYLLFVCGNAVEVQVYFTINNPADTFDQAVRFIVFLSSANDFVKWQAVGDGEG